MFSVNTVMYTLLLLLTLFQTASAQCPLGNDAYINGLCYTVSTYKATFGSAEFACNGRQQTLAIIQNSLQSNLLATVVRNITGEPNGVFWIGLSRKNFFSKYQWEDGTLMTWSNFDTAYPQNALFVAESTTNGKWRTVDGQESHYFACSYDPNASPRPTTWQPDSTYYPYSTTDSPVSSTYGPWSTDFPGESTTYRPYTTDYPSSDSTYWPWSTNFPGESTTYRPYTTGYPDSTYYPDGTTGYPYPDSTYYPGGSTNYPDGTTGYPYYDSTYYPGASSTYSPFGTTRFSALEKLPKSLKKLLRNYKP
uniref:C-type lectin domain-containing protein n=1 Tax=Caenorhabditis tropicalis TaxID=1561998 RepID=A0A1I7TQ03_9PELO